MKVQTLEDSLELLRSKKQFLYDNNSPDLAENGAFIASLEDLFGMKCATLSQRAVKKGLS